MIKLTEEQVVKILQTQDRMRRRLATGKTISCPFYELAHSNASAVCQLCHRWMGTSSRLLHPCIDLEGNMNEVKKRFWRNPRRLEDG